MGDYKYIVFVEPLDGVLNIEKILENVRGEYIEHLIDNQMTLEKVLDSFGEDGQKIYNILTNKKVKKGMKPAVNIVDGINIPEGLCAISIDEKNFIKKELRECEVPQFFLLIIWILIGF